MEKESNKIAYRPEEARGLIGLKSTKFAELLRRGEIKSIKLDNRAVLIPRKSLEEFIARKLEETANANQ